MIKKIFLIVFFLLFMNQIQAKENNMILKLKDGNVVIQLYEDVAPNHVKRFKLLAKEKKYDGVVFQEDATGCCRVSMAAISGLMRQVYRGEKT